MLSSSINTAITRVSSAATVETLVMPDELIEGHAEFESDCSSCHAKFKKVGQTNLCRACHEDVDEDIVKNTGFHGRNEQVQGTGCASCHTDHIGRDADIVQLDRETLNHEKTDFPLLDAHRLTVCESCHFEETRFREAPATCIDCHEDDDVHRGNLGTECESCHLPDRWMQISFAHDETDFPLIGSHTEPTCNACHFNQTFDGTPSDCIACHQIDDAHRGKRGTDCGECHSPKGWDQSVFDHGRHTDFSLLGRHADTRCNACHIEPPEEKQLKTNCVACHQGEDEHKGKRGDGCDRCHTSENWRETIFNHSMETGFELHFRHSEIPCESCHKRAVSVAKPDPQCYSCHRIDDSHHGQQGEDCARCHNDAGWHTNVVFEHDLTRFPLIGLHAAVPCEECHLTAAFQDTSGECADCHRDDDYHEGGLGPACANCHTPNSWDLWEFDHDVQTNFVLLGAHEGLQCAACHKTPVRHRISLTTTCRACHEEDDVHLGRFGRNCQRCHNNESFSEILSPGQ